MNLQALRYGNERIVQTHATIVALDQMLSTMQDAETGQRGFLLTEEPRYLGPFERAQPRISSDLAALRVLLADDARQTAVLNDISGVLDQKMAELSETIEMARTGRRDAALQVVQSDRGRLLMERARVQLGILNANAEGRVRVRLAVPVDNDARRVREVALEAIHARPEVLRAPEPSVLLDGLDGGNLVFFLTAYVDSPRNTGGIRSALLIDLLERLRAAGIVLSAPQEISVRERSPATPAATPGGTLTPPG